MENVSLFKKIFGCLVGGAIGDAFGIRVEMMHYLDIKEQYGWVTHFDDLPHRQPSSQPPLERWNPLGVQMGYEEGFHPLGRWSHEAGVYTDDMRLPLDGLPGHVEKRWSDKRCGVRRNLGSTTG